MRRELELQLGERVDVGAGRPPDLDACRHPGERRRRRLPDRVDVLLPEPDPEPGVDECSITRRRDGVVGRSAFLYPAARSERVEVAYGFRLLDRVPRRLDPDVRPPGVVGARGPEHEADDRAAAGRNRSRGVGRGERRDGLTRDRNLLVGGGQARLDCALGGVPAREQAGRVVEVLRGVRMDFEARHRAGR